MAGPPDTLRYGLIGTGMMGIEHLWNLQHVAGAEVTAIADPHEGSRDLAVLAAGEGGATFERFVDHRELLASGLCDVVVVATPNHTHLPVMLDVLAHDVHVLVEKPLATTVAGCRQIIDAARARPSRAGFVWVGLEYRYMPPVARLVADVHAGAVGTPRMVAIREHRFPFLAKIGDWNRFSRNTGGTLVEKCCHFFDLMGHVLEDRPVRVMASGGQDVNHLDESYDGEVPDIIDNALVVVDFAGGARASLDLCMFAEASENQEEISVVGDTGKVEAFLPSCEVRLGTRSTGRPGVSTEVVHDARVAYEGFHHGSSYLEHLDLADAVRSGAQPAVGLEEGLMSVAVGVAAHRSIDEGRVVTLDEVLADG
ncbi:Gfo/Idh/MocA family oxidoreductase [Iamia sp.]|uniref:Gfo/Idh/MocA family protein n=1 Tax=Iamia sp. TaxID=2722710 RepID=UPI002CA660B8|nr:Gfo/Idh/MocA family oxidoreductase [Iamia sp.]HXH58632.1 Gfo/Idh/MocA family oxidoreductase [Iamia sp.]